MSCYCTFCRKKCSDCDARRGAEITSGVTAILMSCSILVYLWLDVFCRPVLCRSLARVCYGLNLARLSLRISPKCAGHTNVTRNSRSFIAQFLSLLSGSLWSRSVSLIREIFYGLNLAGVSLRIFVRATTLF